MSRARLGLYVFCRRSLFEQCYELQPTFRLLLQRPDRLALNLQEVGPNTERLLEDTGAVHLVSGLEEMGSIVDYKLRQIYEVYSLPNNDFFSYSDICFTDPILFLDIRGQRSICSIYYCVIHMI